jgi:tryptophan synthase alpha chain
VNRLDGKFAELARRGRKGLVGYLTAGDPDRAACEADVRAAIEAGLDVLELGVPFSDPTADGPTIQEASRRALAAGMDVEGALDMVRVVRRGSDVPIVLFGYANPFFRRGYGRMAADAAAAGADGLLVVDLPWEESAELRGALRQHGLHLVPLVAPTTPPERAARILEGAGGFVYYISVTGVTGARAGVAEGIGAHVRALRRVTKLPIAVGFGVSSGEQARAAGEAADAVVVGSALVRAAREGRLPGLVRELRTALDGPPARRAGPR